MACSIKDIKSDSMDVVRSIVKGNAKTITFTKNGDALITPSPNSKKVRTIVSARKLAEQKVRLINKWSRDKFGSDAYQGQWTAIYESPSDVRLELKFPKKLEEHYIIKEQRQEAQKLQEQDAERAGLVYADDYLFDDLPATADGFNYGLYVKKKKEMRDYFSTRISVLENMSNKTKETFEQISDYKEIVKNLNKDIKHLDNEEAILENFFNYFNNDLNIIENVLFNNQTKDNLLSAREMIDEMRFVLAYDPSSANKSDDSKVVFSDVKRTELTPSQRKMFDEFESRLNRIESRLDIAEQDYLATGLENENLVDDSEEKAQQISFFARNFLPIDGSSDSSPIMKFVRKTYDDAVGKSETNILRQSLESIKNNITKKLEKEGKKFSLFTRKNTDGSNTLAGKFNDEWNEFFSDVNRKFKTIQEMTYKKDKDAEDYEKIRAAREGLFDKMNGNVEFIDVRRIPDLKNHPELQSSFSTFFSEDTEAEQYKEELIQSLIGENGNRESAERIYNRIVEEQLEKIFQFEVDMQRQLNRVLKEEGVDEFKDLSDKNKNIYMSIYYTNSPFAFADSYTNTGTSTVQKVYFKEGESFIGTDTATMEYQSILPKDSRFIDRDFEKDIESDPEYFEAWKMMDTGVRYINKNRKYKSKFGETTKENALIYEQDLYKQNVDGILSLAKYYSKSALDRIRKVLSTSKFKDKTNVKMVNKVASSIDEIIKNRTLPKLKVMKAFGYDAREVVHAAQLSDDAVKYLRSITDKPIPTSFVTEEFLTEISTDEVMNSQNDNIFEVLNTQLEVIEKFKAKKEIESKLLFLKNLIENKSKTTDPEERENNRAVVMEFINANLYDVNNRANWGFKRNAPLRQSKDAGSIFYSYAEEETIDEINKAINLIKELRKEMTDTGQIEQANKDIDALIAYKKSKGQIISPGSITETFAIKIPIMAGLGLNLPSQIGNLFMGNLSGRQNDGIEWKSGNFIVADSYTRKWKIARRKLSKNERERQRLTNTLISSLGVFQNSANEVHKVIESDFKNKALKYATNPLHIVGDMEKTIQRPQILAKLGDIMITDKNGNEVPAFDVNNTSEPHPAFKLVKGVLHLKEEFDTEENRATWINRNSQRYADLFGESGEIPRMIARINGDYRNSSKTGIKQTTLGATFMMFKTWLPAFIQRRYGRKDGVISNLFDSGRAGQTMMLTSMTAAGYLLTGPMVYFSPLFTIMTMAGYMGYRAFQKSKQDDMNYLDALKAEIKTIKFKMSFVKTPFQLTAGVAAKFAQQSTNLIFGKQQISDSAIASLAGIRQKEEETDEDFELNKARLNFLLTEASTTLTLLMLKTLVNALLFPDEEEEKKYKELDGFYEKVSNDPDTAAYYFFENMFTRFADDANLLNDGASMASTLKLGVVEKTTGLANAAYQQFANGNYQKGPHAGENRIVVKGSEFFVPRGMLDWSLGFGKTIRQDYRQKDELNKVFMSDIDKYEGQRQKMRAERKIELKKELENRYPNKDADYVEKKLQKQLRKEFPTIKKYFNEDGTLKPWKKNKVSRYD